MFAEANLKKHTFNVGSWKFQIYNDIRDTLLAWSLENEGTWEPWQINLYGRLLRPDSVCLDIGGNIGTSAIAMSPYCYAGKIFSFEPIPHTYKILEKNIHENALRHIHPLPFGVSDQQQTIQIALNRELLGNAHRVDRDADALKHDLVEAKVVALDEWRTQSGIEKVDFVKVDVEGWELEVVSGGLRTFSDPDVVAIFEFAVAPQRIAGGKAFPGSQKDVKFFEKLREIFSYTFLIGRDFRLYPVSSYAELRSLMLGGYPVEDLLCCHSIPDGVRDLIAPSGFEEGKLIANSEGMAVVRNRYEDGWAAREKYADWSGVGVLVALKEPGPFRLTLDKIYSAHSLRPQHHILVAQGNDVQFAEITDDAKVLALNLGPGPNWIFLEAEYYMEAQSYFGNPTDQRQVGFRLSLPAFGEAT